MMAFVLCVTIIAFKSAISAVRYVKESLAVAINTSLPAWKLKPFHARKKHSSTELKISTRMATYRDACGVRH